MPGTPVTLPGQTFSYATLADAENYFLGRLVTDAWDNASSAKQQKALIQSTRAIDRLKFYGVKTASDQALEFPRNGETAIPQDIVDACVECAYALLDGIDPELEIDALATTQFSLSDALMRHDRTFVPEHFRAGIPSATAWTILLPYLQDPYELRLSRV